MSLQGGRGLRAGKGGSSYRRGESGREGTGRGSWGHRKGQGLVWKNKNKERWRPSRRLEGARCSGRATPRSHFGFVGFSWEPSGGDTNLPHTCPFLPSPVTRLPLCSGLSCRSRGGCCCTAKETAMESCLVAPTMNKAGCIGEQVPVYLGEF